jgi:hypothetical protein
VARAARLRLGYNMPFFIPPATPTDIDEPQVWKEVYDEPRQALKTQVMGIAVSHGTDKDVEQVMKQVYDVTTKTLRIVEV